MNIKGKTKDNDNSREDLKNICDRVELDMDDDGVYQPAQYNVKKKGATLLYEWVKTLRFPDGYVSNMGRCVDEGKYKLSKMKSHDCHVFMQKLAPIAFRELLPEYVWEALAEFSLFFKDLSCSTLRVGDTRRLEKEIPIILCKLEQFFPPSFFDSMEHLPVHLPYEARIGGPVQFRWMYPFKRYLKHLKKNVGNKARVEGSMGNAYLTEETSNFGSHYFEPHVYTRRRKVSRNDDGGERANIPGNLSIFTHPIRLAGKCIERSLSEEEYNAAWWYVLQNCNEVQPYVSYYTEWLKENGLANTVAEVNDALQEFFPTWFKNNANSKDIFISSLAEGPLGIVKSYPVCFVNGYKFHTMKYGSDKITANSGVCLKGSVDLSDPSSSNDYYGLLTDILELEYPKEPIKRTVMFKCQWFDPSLKGKNVHKRYNLVDINIKISLPEIRSIYIGHASYTSILCTLSTRK